MISISGFSFSGLVRGLIGYADDADVLPLIRGSGVRAPDYHKLGIRALPSFKAALVETMKRVPRFRNPQARGMHAGYMNGSYGSVRRSAAEWFIANHIEKHRCVPVGSFSFEVDFGPDLPVRNEAVKNARGRLKMDLDLPESEHED